MEVHLNLSTLKKPLFNITEDETEQTITFNYLKKADPTSIGTIDTDNQFTNERIYKLDGRYIGTDSTTLPKGIYIIGGKKLVK